MTAVARSSHNVTGNDVRKKASVPDGALPQLPNSQEKKEAPQSTGEDDARAPAAVAPVVPQWMLANRCYVFGPE